MTISRDQLQRAAAVSGFPAESYEKVHVLVRLLEAVRTHPFLGLRMVLKGGTALNLFLLDLPRLSVDIDQNYVASSNRATMLVERPRVEHALQQVTGRMGFTLKRAPTEHAGGTWRLSYATAIGRQGSIEVDVNFMLRTPRQTSWRARTSSASAGLSASARTSRSLAVRARACLARWAAGSEARPRSSSRARWRARAAGASSSSTVAIICSRPVTASRARASSSVTRCS